MEIIIGKRFFVNLVKLTSGHFNIGYYVFFSLFLHSLVCHERFTLLINGKYYIPVYFGLLGIVSECMFYIVIALFHPQLYRYKLLIDLYDYFFLLW